MGKEALHLPDLESLALLVRVAELGSVGQAALRQGLTQPSASSRLSTLERHLGLQLLVRTPAGSRLTPEGALVVGWARDVLAAADQLLAGAQAVRRRRDVDVPVVASMTIAEYLVPQWLTVLGASHPDLRVSLSVANSGVVAERVLSGEAVLGFVEGPGVPRGLRSRRVGTDRLVVVVAPGHPWARRRTALRPAELAATPLVVRESGSGTRISYEAAMAAYAPLAEPALELASTAAVKVAVQSGRLPAVLSAHAVRDDVGAGRLVAVEPVGVDLSRALRAVWRAGRALPEPAAMLLAVAAADATAGGQRERR